jgi:Flp pilus assembly CpaE family ATPase
MGVEASSGWRWDSLRSASGQVSALNDRLPATDGVVVLSTSRAERAEPPAVAVAAVLDSLSHSCGLVVVDLGRSGGPARQEAIEAGGRLLLLTGCSVRAVAAAQAALAELGPRPCDVVVRSERGAALGPAAVAEALGRPLLGVVPSTPALLAAADRGLPPGTSGGGRWTRACRRLSAQLVATPTAERRGRWSR